MSSRGVAEDVAFLLYLAPLMIGAAWLFLVSPPSGLPPVLDAEAYRRAGSNPWVLVTLSGSNIVAIVMDAFGGPKDQLALRWNNGAQTMKVVAYAWLLLSVISAWGAAGYGLSVVAVSRAFLSATNNLLYPLTALSISLALASFNRLKGLAWRHQRGLVFEILALIAPLSIFVGWRIGLPAPTYFGLGLVFLLAAVILAVKGGLRSA